jgi:putative transcriptional regulator
MNLKNHFLIAMPGMNDPTFAKTVILICEHGEDGALGLIVNRAIDMTMKNLLGNLKIPAPMLEHEEASIYLGGPVQTERGFVLHRPIGKWQTTMTITEDVGLTTSRDILEAFATNAFPEQWMITLGHAGWFAGQLESELAQNAWLTVPADYSIIFDLPPEERFGAAIGLVTSNMANLSTVVGHA